MKNLFYLFIPFILLACADDTFKEEKPPVSLAEGAWVVSFKPTLENEIPVNAEIIIKENSFKIVFSNDTEEIIYDDIYIDGNNFKVTDPVFNSWFEGEIINENKVKGVWHKEDKSYNIPFTAVKSNRKRFQKPEFTNEKQTDVSGKWQVDFSRENPEDYYPAIGLFKQQGEYLTGTFLTETGDYRFLEGNMYGEEFYLSCYDGAHLFLFKAILKNDTLKGRFWSGNHWEEPWIAYRNEDAKLSDPDSLTYLKEGYNNLAFTFPNTEGKQVSLTDDKYKNKVVIVNIMGSWCPNCKDETAYLAKLYQAKQKEGLEIVALSFNKTKDFEKSKATLNKLKTHFNADYDFLIAGKANKIEAAKALPMLNHVMSYPTSIFIDRKGNIRKIRTGFYGPSTGDYYTRYIEQVDDFIDKLLKEE